MDCFSDLAAGRHHLVDEWFSLGDFPLRVADPVVIIAGIAVLIVWLVLSAKIVGAKNLRGVQKWGWFLGLTFIFPVFSVLYLSLLPVRRRTSKQGAKKAEAAAPQEPAFRHL